MKNIYILSCFFIGFITYAQEVGQASWNYTEQTDLDNFANQGYESISNSLVLTTLCEADFPALSVNETLEVSCIYDLNGETITVPEGVTIAFFGGDIINGTITFTSSGQIAGELLSSNLTVEGDVSLINTTFRFNPERWDVVQGTVDNTQATANKDALNKIISLVTSFGALVFEIDYFDAFFAGEEGLYTTEQDRSYEYNSIKLLSNLHLKMSDNTYLRVFPNNDPAPRLITGYIGNDITVTGGNLIGDRYTHDYAPVNDFLGLQRNDHGYGTLLAFFGCKDVLVEGVTAENSSGDALVIGGSTIRFVDGTVRPGHQQSENVIIRDNIFDGARRNNISAVDGQYIYIENNQIINAGGGEWIYDDEGDRIINSSGVAPQYGIDLEAYRERDEDDNSLQQFEIIQDVEIRGNTFIGNQQGDVTVNIANDVLVEDNVGDNRMGIKASYNVTFQGNTLTARETGVDVEIGINFNSVKINDEELVYNVKVLNNTISGFKNAMNIGAEDVTISGNTLIGFTNGIIFSGSLKNAIIENNTYESSEPNSLVYFTLEAFNPVLENVLVQNEVGDVVHRPISLSGVNVDALDTQHITFDNLRLTSTRNSPLFLLDSNNITIQNSAFENGVDQTNTQGVILLNNTIISVE